MEVIDVYDGIGTRYMEEKYRRRLYFSKQNQIVHGIYHCCY